MIDPDLIIELDSIQSTYYQDYRVRCMRDRMAGRLKQRKHQTLKSALAMGQRQGLMLGGPGVAAMDGGFGDLPQVLVAFPHKETAHAPWHRVHEALAVTGATFEQYEQLLADELDEVREEGGTPRFDSYRSYQPDGSSIEVPCANWQMVMLLMLMGPRGEDFSEKMRPVFREAMVTSGLGDALGTVVARVNGDGALEMTGETITDAILNNELVGDDETHFFADEDALRKALGLDHE